jgi:hypothetical protein
MPAGTKLLAYFRVVVNFAVEGDNDVPVFTEEGLVSRGQIDNLQTYSAEGHIRTLIDSTLIRAPVLERTNRIADMNWCCELITVRKTDQAAQ